MTLQEDERDKIDILFTKFEEYCKPRQNITMECYRFNSRSLETVDQYVTELKLISKNWGYGELENQLLRDRVICGIHSDKVKQHLLRVDDLILAKCLRISRSYEQTKKSVQILADNPHVVVDDVKRQKSKKAGQTKNTEDKRESVVEPQPKDTCSNCGRQYAK